MSRTTGVVLRFDDQVRLTDGRMLVAQRSDADYDRVAAAAAEAVQAKLVKFLWWVYCHDVEGQTPSFLVAILPSTRGVTTAVEINFFLEVADSVAGYCDPGGGAISRDPTGGVTQHPRKNRHVTVDEEALAVFDLTRVSKLLNIAHNLARDLAGGVLVHLRAITSLWQEHRHMPCALPTQCLSQSIC